MKIYKLSGEEVDYELIENQTYKLDFQSEDYSLILKEINNAKLSNFIDWQEGNRLGKLCISNYIGNIYFFKKTYNVKSVKFLKELSGVEQFKKVLNEIEQLSKNIIFSYNSPSFILREVDYKNTNPSTLLIFNYFKKIILDWDSTINLETSISRILKNPNFKYSKLYEKDKIEKIKKINNKTIKLIVNKTNEVTKLRNQDTHLLNLPLTQFLSRNSSESYFPTKSFMEKNKLSYDTLENRFVKHFVRYVASFAYRLNFVKNLPASVHDEKELILKVCRNILNKSFFREIGEMTVVPTNSTVLQSRIGYKDILQHYSRSQFGIMHIFEEFEKNALSVDLKRISDLYEYWVFYKIAKAFLGNDIIVEQQSILTEEGNLSYGVCFKNETISVYYNWTESKARQSSYSVSFRPDVTVAIKSKDGSIMKLIFDAKYKVERKEREDNTEGHVKIDDIHKMHAYVDAIKDTLFAIVVYPGTEFLFYEKQHNTSIKRSVNEIDTFIGVGAIPLTPENIEQDIQLQLLVNRIKDFLF
ncbi:DUF2357 domain-containing protein [Flavobacterium sp. S87F.05.LMB.W.Kidney.N]|uniref:DUF2357 domain-containing protein n=1 Tax=Flavobacterium sp. S87F.05.LMB.W.Kidney.N TaxID=1278758 RepID=UPI0010666B9D|nr:DUF2357 domain-containing protein [Flavobacterium sp. S87F.05.LMB.W.Kidney.N]TDX11303.1 hypothetical protein EDB96_2088 [Flavobacterium sp. S87F.05.LMB.W.Kidney.N]